MADKAEVISVLHVDDEPEFAEMAATCLERIDDRFNVVTAVAADDGLARLASTDVDCIVSDYDMPETNGLEFLRAVRREHPDFPFILFTGKGSEEIASDAISAGVTDYLQKEVGTDQYTVLANRVNNAIEQYHSRQALEERNQELLRYEGMVNSMHEAACIYDSEGRFEVVNKYLAGWYDIAPDELEGTASNLIPRIQDLVEGNPYEELLEGERRELQGEIEAEFPGHGFAVLEYRLTPLYIGESIDGVVGVARDITERKEREQALETLHDVTAEIVSAEDKTDVAEIIVDAATRVLDIPIAMVWYYDDTANGLVPVGGSQETTELIGERPVVTPSKDCIVWEVYDKGQRRLVDDLRQETGAFHSATELSTLMVLPLGDHGTLNAGATRANAFDEGDVFLAELLTTTARTVLDRLEQEAEVRVERDQFRSLFELIPEPVTQVRFEADEPIILDVNPAFEATFGCDAERVIGQSANDLLVPAKDRQNAEQLDYRIRTEGVIEAEVSRKTADGMGDFLFLTVPASGSKHDDEYFGIYVEVTEERTKERVLERQNERLDEFTSVISHDLQNPLNVAIGRLELARAEYDSEDLERVAAALDRMDALIEETLALARAGRIVGERTSVDIAVIAKRCWRSIETSKATLMVDTAVTVFADESRLQQLLENLFRNAVEHGGEGVTVRLGSSGSGFFVADDGPGIPKEEREDIFESGYSTTVDGTGLGLNIVSEIAEAHEWDVTLTESAEGGARFEFTNVEVAH